MFGDQWTTNKEIKEALNHFGFMLEYDQEYTAKEFAQVIRKRNTSLQGEMIARSIENLQVKVLKGRGQTTISRL